MRFALLQGQAVQKPLQLPPAHYLNNALRLRGPLEMTPLQSPIVEPETIVIPSQDLKLVASAVAEDKPAICEGIEVEGILDQGRQPINGLAHIRGPASQVNALCRA